jgi:hypothetical protein
VSVPSPLAVIVRYRGQPKELLERFERARRLWVENQGRDYEQPIFYAACKDDAGIAILMQGSFQ